MLRTSLLGAPVLVIVLLLHGSASSSTTTTVRVTSPVTAFILPAPPATDPPTTTTVAPTTTTEPPTTTTTEPPTTAPPETAAPETSPPTEAAPPAPKPRRTTTSREAPPATEPPDTEAPKPVAVAGDASAVIGLTNQQRAAAGLAPLNANSALHAAAQRQSNDMAAHMKMSHTGSDGSTVATRASAAGYSWHALGENIAVGYGSASAVVTGWMNSAGHRANILNGTFNDIGVAVATGADGNKYWTMVLGA